jgi:hypothetical protein
VRRFRFRLSRWLIHTGLWVWPPGPAKDELLAVLGAWGRHVMRTVSHSNGEGE